MRCGLIITYDEEDVFSEDVAGELCYDLERCGKEVDGEILECNAFKKVIALSTALLAICYTLW